MTANPGGGDYAPSTHYVCRHGKIRSEHDCDDHRDNERESDDGGMDNQGAQIEALRAEVAQQDDWYADLQRRARILDQLLTTERAEVERLTGLVEALTTARIEETP